MRPLRNGLTKENFWDEIESNFPNAMRVFKEWIDEYKRAVFWDILFCNQSYIKPTGQFTKYQDLPYDMQAGIWIGFAYDVLNDYFEQPEYSYTGDLEEDVKEVFKAIEKTEIEINNGSDSDKN